MSSLNHVGITVSDIEESIRFYRDVVGMEELSRSRDFGGEWFDRLTENQGTKFQVAHLGLGGFTLQLVEYQSAGGDRLPLAHNQTGNPHICINVDDVEGKYADLEGSSVRRLPFTQHPTGTKSFYVLDPDGVMVEFLQRPAGQ
jgi:catechol 2,3-dioxygenase-like lactoylglutathione lyase family enzyme